MDIIEPKHEAFVEHLFQRTCIVLGTRGFTLKPLRRRLRGKGKYRTLMYGYTRIGVQEITIDFYTPKTMKPRKTDAIIRVICHELTHHQAPPRVCWYKGRRMHMDHHPRFWKKYKKNVECISKDDILGQYFS
jgi:predicted SprT family Zn-dependent metalloprotease